MAFEVHVSDRPGYVRVDVSGPTSVDAFDGLIVMLARHAGKNDCRRVVVDLRHDAGRLTPQEQQLVGELAAARLPMLFKLASTVPEDAVSRISEGAAIRAGLLLRVFDSDAAALFWLVEG